jgi:hypothetical protein
MGQHIADTSIIAQQIYTLQNSSGRISGMGQHIADIAENQSLSIDQDTRQELTEIGEALNSVAQDFDGVYQSNSSSS